MNLILKGTVPSKKNSRINLKDGRSFPSKNYTEWHKVQSGELMVWKNQHSINRPFGYTRMVLSFYPRDERIADLTNKAESVMDLLVDNRILKDDNWFVVGDLRLLFGCVDRDNPRVEIEFN